MRTPLLRSGGAALADNPFPEIKMLIESGQYDQAMALSAHLTKDPEMSALSQKFTYALILKRQGKLKQAAGIMRAILAEKPNLSRVRQELAHTLSLMGEKKAAIYHFSILADNAPSESLRSFYEDFRDRQFTQIAQFQASLGQYGITQDASIIAAQAATLTTLSIAERAIPALTPSSPQTVSNVIIAAVLGLVTAGFLAFLIEYLDDRIKSPDELENITGLKTMGSVFF